MICVNRFVVHFYLKTPAGETREFQLGGSRLG